MAVQDDARETELIKLFQLAKREEEGRAGCDACLSYKGGDLQFEVKSTTDSSRSVTTVRDFGPDHLKKWVGKHWLIGFYARDGKTLEYSMYGSPRMMEGWIKEKEEYVRTDFVLAASLSGRVEGALVRKLLGEKRAYTLDDARRIQKRQYTMPEYIRKMDRPGGYTPARMLEIIRDRARYLLERGATLNNPHIPGSYFSDWEKITANHARRLRALVAAGLQPRA